MAIVSHSIKPLIIIVKSPTVAITNGIENSVTIGLIIAFMIEKISPAKRNVAIISLVEPLQLSPKSVTTIQSDNEQANHLSRNKSIFFIPFSILARPSCYFFWGLDFLYSPSVSSLARNVKPWHFPSSLQSLAS